MARSSRPVECFFRGFRPAGVLLLVVLVGCSNASTGTSNGLPYNGSAPDLGPFESVE
jgi:hypothetical protein